MLGEVSCELLHKSGKDTVLIIDAPEVVSSTPMTRDEVAEVAKALGHAARLCILEQLQGHAALTAGELVEGCGLAQSTVSEHLRILRDAGVVSVRADGPRNWYRLERGLLARFARNAMYLTARRR
jgi:ArsR family transcriptional regulator